MKRGAGTSGSDEHVELVKLATKRIVDTFQNLRYILISFEQHEMKFDIEIKDALHGFTNAHFELRPDIVLRAENTGKGSSIMDDAKLWKSIMDSTAIVFEAETDPANIFHNILKLDAYRRIKAESFGRAAYAFVLVCWDNAVLPRNVDPFDEVWKFPRLR
jgi:hypothetical protein